MAHALAIARREISGYFGHPLAYIALLLFVALVAAFTLWFDGLLLGGTASMRSPFFWSAVSFLLLVPAITMRSIAEERRTGSLEMVGTLPITTGQLVVGKWLATVALVATALALTLGYPIALAILGELDPGPVVGGYLGLLLLGAALCAVGVAASAATDSQVVAFLLALAVGGAPWALGWFLPLVPGEWVPVVQYLTVEYHFSNLARGVLDTRSVVFYLSSALLALQLAIRLLEHRRLS